MSRQIEKSPADEIGRHRRFHPHRRSRSQHHFTPVHPLPHHRAITPLHSHSPRPLQQIHLPSRHSQTLPQSPAQHHPVRAAHRNRERPVQARFDVGSSRAVFLTIPSGGAPARPRPPYHRLLRGMGHTEDSSRRSFERRQCLHIVETQLVCPARCPTPVGHAHTHITEYTDGHIHTLSKLLLQFPPDDQPVLPIETGHE